MGSVSARALQWLWCSTSGGRSSSGCVPISQGSPRAVAPSPCFDPHRGAGAQPCPAQPAVTEPSVPKGKTRGSLRMMRFLSTRTEPILQIQSSPEATGYFLLETPFLLPGRSSAAAPAPAQVRGCRQLCFSFFLHCFSRLHRVLGAAQEGTWTRCREPAASSFVSGRHLSPVAPCHYPSSQGTRQVVFCSRSSL